VKRWEVIADTLSKAGWSWGCVSAVDSQGRTIFVADAHRDDGKRFVGRSDDKLTAFWNWKRRFAILARACLTTGRDFSKLDVAKRI
jgi:hypothetical protein